jgi:hypothetical protein
MKLCSPCSQSGSSASGGTGLWVVVVEPNVWLAATATVSTT